MYILGMILCLISAVIYGIDGNIPAMTGFIVAIIGGGCGSFEERKRIKLETEIKTLSQWN